MAVGDGHGYRGLMGWLGAWYGWGYCPRTDWHWQVRRRLGFDDPPSYIQLLIREVTGADLRPDIANALAVVGLAGSGLLGAVLSLRDWLRARAPQRG